MRGLRARRTRRRTVMLLGVLAVVLLVGRLALQWAYPMKYSSAVEQYAAEYGLSPALIYGIIHTESRFRSNAVSPIGARGLMQITEETFEWARWRCGDNETTYDQLFEPETNIRYGTYIFSLLLKEFGQPEEALAAYHAGWGSVKNWLSTEEYSSDGVTLLNIPFKDTAQYVPRVKRTAKIYARAYGKR
ncbi:MAG TPA: lytic transglycosylase domain-containing protein [Clostridia bacterium]|nr:lytic transglycosylase domain-containing protein [Clostridia bacterium]